MGVSSSAPTKGAQPASPPPITSHSASTSPEAAAPNLPTPPSANLDILLQGVETIRRLEFDHKKNLALLAKKREEVANLHNQYEEVWPRCHVQYADNLCYFMSIY